LHQEDVRGIYKLFSRRFYLGEDTFKVKGGSFEPIALFGILTYLVGGNELIFGNPGTGKTASSERISSILGGFPIELIQTTEIQGHPEQTLQTLIGTLDLGRLEKEGIEEIIWKARVFLPQKIIDEINRLPPRPQNELLKPVGEDIWQYRGEAIIPKRKGAFYATINFPDIGSNPLIRPLKERFDIGVCTGRLNPFISRVIRYNNRMDEPLEDKETTREILKYVKKSRDVPEKVFCEVSNRSDEFKAQLEKRFKEAFNWQGHIPRREELEEIYKDIEEMPVASKADLLVDYLSSEINWCRLSPKKDFGRCGKCHYKNFACSSIYQFSMRAEKSLLMYSKALAWFLGDPAVDVDHVISVAPFATWHRYELNPSDLEEIRDESKNSLDEFYLVNDLFSSIMRRWREVYPHQVKAYSALLTGKELPKQLPDHPYFKSLTEE